MFMENLDRRTVNLDNLRKNSIVIVDLDKPLSESVFAQEYQNAAQVIRNIIAYNAAVPKMPECEEAPNLKWSGAQVNRSGFHTAVPFIGERGTGKTSIMCSILQYLAKFKGISSKTFDLGEENRNTRFIALDMIDANTLKSSEDVLLIVLSRLLSYIEAAGEGGNCDDFRELYRKLDALYNDLSRVYQKESVRADESGLMNLKRIADSQKSIESFHNFIAEFRRQFRLKGRLTEAPFLVLALDDIDMYQGSTQREIGSRQFSLLEEIYDYMRVPGLIVLLTYNENILKRNCNTHFRGTYFGHHAQEECTPAERREIETLTRQFIAKLFPSEQRIYLPNFMYVDSANRPNLYIQTEVWRRPENTAPFTDVEWELPVKDFMLRLIAHKTGIYFDIAGTKKHFFEPRNLRELGSLYQIISSMGEVEETAHDWNAKTVRRANCLQLLNYLRDQFAGEQLNAEEWQHFQNLSMLPLLRQVRTLVDSICQYRMNEITGEDDFGYLAKTKKDRWKYSYGELLHNIYFATRIPRANTSDVFYCSKEFIHCILGTDSILMNQILCKDQFQDTNESEKTKARDEWADILGSSVAGRWANDMLPGLYSDSIAGQEKAPLGSISLPINEFFSWALPSEIQAAVFQLGKESFSPESGETVGNFMRAFILIGMFFSGFPQTGLKIQIEAGFEQKQEEMVPVLYLKSTSKDHLCFNALNFVINLRFAIHTHHMNEGDKTYFGYIKGKLQKLGRIIIAQHSRNFEEELQEAERELEKVKRAKTDIRPSVSGSQSDMLNRLTDEWTEKKRSAEAWNNMLAGSTFHAQAFEHRWNALLEALLGNGKTTGEYPKKVRKWENSHKTLPFVLPVQHFDMMYNIIKRLSNVSYYDIPEEAPIDDVYNYFVRLYENIGRELDKQDHAYFPKGDFRFADAYRNCLFYQVFTAKEGSADYNPYLREFLTAMLKTAAPSSLSREIKAKIPLPVPSFKIGGGP